MSLINIPVAGGVSTSSMIETSYHSGEKKGVKAVQEQMENRNSIGWVVGRLLGRFIFGTLDENYESVDPKELNTRTITKINTSALPFKDVYESLFPQQDLNLFYAELDPGVDDAMALNLLLAAAKSSSNPNIDNRLISLQAVVASVGNAVLSQTEQNVLELLALAQPKDGVVYAGARAPLAMQNNTQAILQLEKQINATHRYGYDGLEDVGGWPNVTASVQEGAGYLKICEAVIQAAPGKAITLVSTAALTDLAQALARLAEIYPEGGFAGNINAVIIRGGCVHPGVECNAPPFLPDDKKNSELSFYFDSPSAQYVFACCQKHGIPIVLLPLSLTQQPELLWTKNQVKILQAINNDVASQMAKITQIVPYLDARRFPAGTYPMHDLFAAAALLRPEFFTAEKVAISIGDLGDITVNATVSDEEKNVYILSMPQDKQTSFYETILKEYENFKCDGTATADGCIPPNMLDFYLKIGIPVGVGVIGLVTLLSLCVWRSKRNQKALADEKTKLLEDKSSLTQENQTLKVTNDGLHSVVVGLWGELGVEVEAGEDE